MSMPTPANAPTPHRRFALLRAASLIVALVVATVGALVLIGWALDVELLKSMLHPGRIAMNPATALCFILCSAVLLLLRTDPPRSLARRVAVLLAAMVIAAAALRIAAYALDWSFGVDRLLFRSRLGENVMAPNTAVTFLMIAMGLLTLDVRVGRRGFHPAQALIIAAGCVALFSVTGYLYSTVTLYGMHGYIPMALNTALAFGLLAVGILASRPRRQPVAAAVSDTLGGIVARRLIPAAFLVPLLLGGLRLVAQRRNWVGAETGLALFVLANILVFNLLIWWCARVLHMSDMRHRRSEEELQQSEQRHRAVMQQAAEGIYLVDLESKRVIESNVALDRLLGYAHGEIADRTVYDFVDDSPENVDERLRRLSEATAPLHGERQYRRKDGSLIEVEVSATVIEYAGRRVATTVVHDITARKQAERDVNEALSRLRESEERHRVVVQQAAEGITLVDAETLRILEVNEAFARLVGYAPQEMIDRPISEFIVDTAAGVASRASQTLGAGTATAVQRQYRRKDGSVVDVEKSATVLMLGGRRVLCTVIHDVTDRNRAERELHEKHRQLAAAHEQLKAAQSQLVQSEKLASLGQMVAGVAHEINNPLAFVSNNVAVLERDSKSLCEMLALYARGEPSIARDDPALAAALRDLAERVDLAYTTSNLPELLSRSREGLKRIQQIVRDLRDFARLDESDRHEVNLNDGIASTVNIIIGRAKKKRVTIEQRLAPLPPVSCHPAKINQVVMNLLSNAIDAAPEGGRVEVATRVNGTGVEIEVSDNGPGIPPDIAGRIFDPFFTTKPVGEGTGLGLSISYGIVNDHGGSMDVASPPGEGARFTVRLPRVSTKP